MTEQYPWRGRFISVRTKPVGPTEEGKFWEIVERPAAVGIVAVTSEQEVVLVRQFRPAVDSDTLEIPAGIIGTGESAVTAARRELAEETGYAADRLRTITTLLASPGYSDERIELILATGCSPVIGGCRTDSRTAVEVVPFNQLARLIERQSASAIDAKTIAGLLWLLVNHQE